MTSPTGSGHGHIVSTQLFIDDSVRGIVPYIFIFVGDGWQESQLEDYHNKIRDFYAAWRAMDAVPNNITAQVYVIDVASIDTGVSHDGIVDNVIKNTYFGFDTQNPNPDNLDAALVRATIMSQLPSIQANANMILVNRAEGFGVTIGNQGMTMCIYASGDVNHIDNHVGIHEWGHGGGAGLADEYTVFDNGEPYSGPEPTAPNITANTNFNTLKWKKLVNVPHDVEHWPTVLNPDTTTNNFVDPYPGRTGLYEGGGYKHKGLFRSQISCLMGGSTSPPTYQWCTVCANAVQTMLQQFTFKRPIIDIAPTITSPVEKRSERKQNLNDYVLTLSIDDGIGLLPIPTNCFTQLITDSQYNINFNFKFCDKNYTSFVVNTGGWIALVDPVIETFSPSDVLTDESFVAGFIRLVPFDTNAIVFAPWASYQLFPVTNALADLNSLLSVYVANSKLKTKHIQFGIEPLPKIFNQKEYAISYCNISTKKGRALVVKWISLSCNPILYFPSSVFKFEIVLYENGTIEYRYAPRESTIDSSVLDSLKIFSDKISGASVGVFMPTDTTGIGINDFRDFSPMLRYDNGQIRNLNKRGGANSDINYLDNNFNDVQTRPYETNYTINLLPRVSWPAQNNKGAIFTFSPPTKLRDILPRNEIKNSDSIQNNSLIFDDRNINIFGSNLVVNYPTKISRYKNSNSRDIADKQDLFSQDFLVTSSVSQNADDYSTVNVEINDNAFNEMSLFEQKQTDFFTTGSSIELFGTALKNNLKSKEIIRLMFPVVATTQMTPLTSSMYYYNLSSCGWNIPQNSSYVIVDDNITGTNFDLATPNIVDNLNGYVTFEDERGFDCVGNYVSSGNIDIDIFDDKPGTDPIIGGIYNAQNYSDAIQKKYTKSICNNSQYEAKINETFCLSIDSPFLIEKAVIEIPFAAGESWFSNITSCYTPIIGTSPTGSTLFHGFDIGGPGLTISLFNQIKSGITTKRELILSGTVTHTNDAITKLTYENNAPYDNTFRIRKTGFLSYSTPTSIISPNLNKNFTGSLYVECEAAVTNGMIVNRVYTAKDSGNPALTPVVQQKIRQILSQKTIDINDESVTTTITNKINPLGRAKTGFIDNGRSIFGKTSLQFLGDTSMMSNPLYTPDFGVPNGTASIVFTSNWNTGYCVNIEIMNVGTDPIASWTFVIKVPNTTVNSMWGASYTQVGDMLTVTGTGADGNEIPGGGSYTFGYCASATSISHLPVAVSFDVQGGQIEKAIEQTHSFIAMSTFNVNKTTPSPYLVMPGDQLILAVSKARPFFYGARSGMTYVSGSHAPSGTIACDDVALLDGMINITLYGSYLKCGSEIN